MTKFKHLKDVKFIQIELKIIASYTKFKIYFISEPRINNAILLVITCENSINLSCPV